MTNLELKNLEHAWRKSQLRCSYRELINIFPEAMTMIEQKIAEYNKQKQRLVKFIKSQFRKISQFKTDCFSSWFCEELIDEFYVKKLIELEKILSRLYFQRKLSRGEKCNCGNSSISQEKIEQARQYPIEKIVMNFKKAYQRNRRIYALCPFHSDKQPSFIAYLETNSWYCFGCQQGGDIIKLISQLKNLNFKETINYLIL